jgi:nucleoid-associated protein YgaU
MGEVDFDLTSEVHSLDDALEGLEDLAADDSTREGARLTETRVARQAPEVDLSGADDSGDGFFQFGDEDAAAGKSDLERTVANPKAGPQDREALESTAAFGEATLPFGMGTDDDDALESTVALPQHALPTPGSRAPGQAYAGPPADLTPLDFDLGAEGQTAPEATAPGTAPSPLVEAATAAAAAAVGGAAISRIEAAMARSGSAEVHPQHVLEPEAATIERAASQTEPATDGTPQKVRIRLPLNPKQDEAAGEPEFTEASSTAPGLSEIVDEEEEAGLQPHWPRIIGLGAGVLLLLWLLSGLFRSGGDEATPTAEQPPPPTAATPAEEPPAAPSPPVAEEPPAKPETQAMAPEEKPPAATAQAPEPAPVEPPKPAAVEPAKPEAAPGEAPKPAEQAEKPKSKPKVAAEEESAASGAAGTYTIRAGDTYRSIARKRLGGSSHWYALVKANPGVDQHRLSVGQTINLPDRGATVRDRKEELEQAREAASGSGTGRTVTIHPGDDLSKIARRVYGKSSAWRLIYNANRDKLSSPRGLKVGTELQIPPRSGDR